MPVTARVVEESFRPVDVVEQARLGEGMSRVLDGMLAQRDTVSR